MYQKGKIYTIRSHQTNEIYVGSTVSTLCKRIAQHRADYKRYLNGTFDYVTSFKLLEYPDFFIELHETYPCDNKEELHRREGEVIRETGESCVNKFIPGRTIKEWYEDNREKIKEYRKENKEHIKEKTKEYRENHRESIADYQKEYRENHRESIADYHKEYQENHRESIADYKKEYYEANKKQIAERVKEYKKNHREQIKEQNKAYREKKKEQIKEYRETNKKKIAEKNKEKMTCECGSNVRKDHIKRHERTLKHLTFINSKNTE